MAQDLTPSDSADMPGIIWWKGQVYREGIDQLPDDYEPNAPTEKDLNPERARPR